MASIEKRGDKYVARWREYANGPPKAKSFDKRKDAQRHLDEVGVSIARGSYLTADELKVTFGQYVHTHLSRQLWRPTTRALAIRALAHAETHFGTRRPLSGIRRSDVEAYVVKLSAEYAPTTVRTTFQHLRTMLGCAQADGILVVDPTLRTKMPSLTASEMVVLTPDEVRSLIAAANPRFRAAIVLGAHAGLRAGEAQGLAVGDIDFLRRTINVRRQLDGHTNTMRLGPVKSAASVRSIPVPSPVLDVLAAHVKEFGPGRDDVLLHSDGGYASDNWFNHTWRRTQVNDGRTMGSLRFHWLRHAFASSLISAGCSVKAVSVAMGHASPVVTLKTYGHLWPGDEDRIRLAINAAWCADDESPPAEAIV